MHTGEFSHSLNTGIKILVEVHPSASDGILIAAGLKYGAQVWDFEQKNKLVVLQYPKIKAFNYERMAFSQKKNTFAVAGNSEMLVWDLAGLKRASSATAH